MPKSDTWPGGTGLEKMPGIDSAGSCDSVLSANSGFSDDSLEHLSAEERACLMFLEETIDSLETEDDSGLSNDETEQKPSPGNVACKLADLSASMSRSTANNEQNNTTKQPAKKYADKISRPCYLVPTPFAVAKSCLSSTAVTKPSITPKKNLCPKPKFSPSTEEVDPQLNQNYEPPPVPIEVNVVIPPPNKTQDYSGKAAESSLQRGPLSYDALVYLRKNASAKKTPLCPTVDHTIDLVNQHSSDAADNEPIQTNLSRFDRFNPEFSQSRTIPPAVPPKPKKVSINTSAKTQNPAAISSSHSFNVKCAPDPEVVRQEALQKLGLLRDKDPANDTLFQTSTDNGLDAAPNRYVKAPSNINPARSPSFCVTRVPAAPKNRSLHSSASFYHPSRRDQPTASHLVQTNRLKTQHSATQSNAEFIPKPHRLASAEPGKGTDTAQKPSNTVGYTVMVVPGMGADRREALRKLGLLKD